MDKENSPNAIVLSPPTVTPTTTTSSSSSSNSRIPTESSSSMSLLKRPSTMKELQSTAGTSSSNKKAKKENDKEEEEMLDLAITLGYQPGDRFQVQWEIEQPTNNEDEEEENEDDDDDDEQEEDNEEKGKTMIEKWWGATLQEYDGRSEDSVAIRVLKYDPYPEFGFPESSLEDVIFLGDSLLTSPDSMIQLNYRREGVRTADGDGTTITTDEDIIVRFNEDGMDEQLNAILMGAFAKNEAMWKSLPPSRQAEIAEKIKTKKEELLKVLISKKEVITASSIKDILRETFGGAR